MTVREAPSPTAALAPRRARVRRLRLGDWGVRLGSIAVVLLIWEFVAPRFNPLIIRSPSAIFRAFLELVGTGELQDALGQSLRDAYKSDGQDPLMYVLAARSFTDLVDEMQILQRRSSSSNSASHGAP